MSPACQIVMTLPRVLEVTAQLMSDGELARLEVLRNRTALGTQLTVAHLTVRAEQRVKHRAALPRPRLL
jgi:hypothetical protein